MYDLVLITLFTVSPSSSYSSFRVGNMFQSVYTVAASEEAGVTETTVGSYTAAAATTVQNLGFPAVSTSCYNEGHWAFIIACVAQCTKLQPQPFSITVAILQLQMYRITISPTAPVQSSVCNKGFKLN